MYRLDEETALVQTVDVFSPSADDPYTFGQIAAANSLSDVYAMGGRPITALSIVGFPLRVLPTEALHEILRGGVDKMAEAGVAVVGGHSINDAEVKAGFAVTGLIHPRRIVTNAAARSGDCLILTKPLGTGIVTFAAQIGRAPAGASEAAARSMAALNRDAARLMIECNAHACTDVTGFGLMGHLGAMAAASGVNVEIVWDDLPLLPGVLECLAEGIASGAVERNRESSGGCLVAAENVRPEMLDLCFDPQTSGGLLIALPASAAGDFLAKLHAVGMAEAAVIGKIVGPGSGRVFLRSDGRRPIPAFSHSNNKQQPVAPETSKMACCDPNHQSDQSATAVASVGGVVAAERKFQEFLQAAGGPGALTQKPSRRSPSRCRCWPAASRA